MSLILEIKTTEKGITVDQVADKYKKKVGEMQMASETAGNKMASVFASAKAQYLGLAAAIGGTVIGIVSAINSTAKYREEIYELSKKTGVSVETLSAMRYVTSQLGGDIGTFAMGMRGLLRNMLQVQQGSKETAKVFEDLGVKVMKNKTEFRPLEEVFFDLADAIKNIGDEGKQAAISMDVYGKAGMDMTLIMQAGTPALKRYFDEAKRAGHVFTAEEAAQADAYGDAVARMSGRLTALKEKAIGPLLPRLTAIFELLMEGKLSFNAMTDAMLVSQRVTENYFKTLNEGIEKTRDGMAHMPEMTIIGHQTELDKALNVQRKSSHEQETQRTAQQIIQKEHLKRIGLDLLEIEISQAEQFDKLFRESGAMKMMKKTFEKMRGTISETKNILQLKAKDPLTREYKKQQDASSEIAKNTLKTWANADGLNATAHSLQLSFMEAGQQIGDNIAGGLARALVYGQSLRDTMKDISGMIASILLEAGIRAGLSALTGAMGIKFLKFDKGGMIPSYQSGGIVTSGYSKPVPIIAHSGEGVLNSERGMRAIGGPAGLARLNAGVPTSGVNVTMNISATSLDERFLRTKMIPALKHELERSGLSLA